MYQVRQKRQNLMDYEDKLSTTMSHIIEKKRHTLAIYIEKMNGLSPVGKLNKGYALISDKNDYIINSAKRVKADDVIKVSMVDGDIFTKVVKINIRRRV